MKNHEDGGREEKMQGGARSFSFTRTPEIDDLISSAAALLVWTRPDCLWSSLASSASSASSIYIQVFNIRHWRRRHRHR